METERRISRDELAALVREARGPRSQIEVARQMGVSQAAVSQAENNLDAYLDSLRIRIIECYTNCEVKGPEAQFTIHKNQQP